LGNGDALITYELDALLMKQNNAKADAEIVIPEATILSEHPGSGNRSQRGRHGRQVIDAFVQYLWTEEAQRAFVKSNFRASISDALKRGETRTRNHQISVYSRLFRRLGESLPGNNREHFSRSGAKEKNNLVVRTPLACRLGQHARGVRTES
jgi:ABC-type sulfate transport system substrate-binding protein